jgi:hypothetical protein
VLSVGIVSCLVAIAATIGYIVGTPDVWDPLGEYPVQTVESRLDGVEGPAVVAGGELTVKGVKCADEAVKVEGAVAWSTVDPPGTLIELPSRGIARRDVGCTSFTFRNKMPAGVLDRVRELAASGQTISVWRISGEDVPSDDEGRKGSPRLWTTDNFKIVVR